MLPDHEARYRAEPVRSRTASGRDFSLPDLTSLREELKNADLALARAQETKAAAERALERARRLLDSIPPAKKDGTSGAPGPLQPEPVRP